MKAHQDFMGWSSVRLIWHGTLVQKETDGTLVQVWIKMGTLHRCQKPAVWHFCRFEICCSYCCSLSMKGILMMLPSTTRGEYVQPHGLETERDGNTAQMSSATCSLVFLHTLKSSPTLQQYEQYTYFILCHTEGGGGSCILHLAEGTRWDAAGLYSVCSCWMSGCIVSSTSTI